MTTAQQFYEKARQAVGGLYVWGGQGHKATENYLKSRAAKYPEYFDGGRLEMMQKRAAADPSLHAWDCSGLVNWALTETGAMPAGFDTTAQGLFASYCEELSAAELQTGDLLFRYSGGKMVHVGIYAPGACVEAAGGAYGVVECAGLTGKQHIARSYVDNKLYYLPDWTHYGRLKVLSVASAVPPAPEPIVTGAANAITTGDVRARTGPGTDYPKVVTAKKGTHILAMPAVDGWREIALEVDGHLRVAYMSDKYIKEV